MTVISIAVPQRLVCRKLWFFILIYNVFLPKYVFTCSNNNDVTIGDFSALPLGNNNMLEAK
jgi:hypothetical protein